MRSHHSRFEPTTLPSGVRATLLPFEGCGSLGDFGGLGGLGGLGDFEGRVACPNPKEPESLDTLWDLGAF
jgi:hypothetical protein